MADKCARETIAEKILIINAYLFRVSLTLLDHAIEEIRLRALDNLISKYDLGFVCECDAVRKRIILKLFNWFSFESVPQPKKVLNFLLRLVQVFGFLCQCDKF